MAEITIYEGPKRFYRLEDGFYTEINSYVNADLVEDEYEIVETVEIDYSKEENLLLEDHEEGENIYEYTGDKSLDDYKIPCTLYKILLPDNEAMLILEPKQDDLEFLVDNVNGLPIDFYIIDKNGKR